MDARNHNSMARFMAFIYHMSLDFEKNPSTSCKSFQCNKNRSCRTTTQHDFLGKRMHDGQRFAGSCGPQFSEFLWAFSSALASPREPEHQRTSSVCPIKNLDLPIEYMCFFEFDHQKTGASPASQRLAPIVSLLMSVVESLLSLLFMLY